MDTESPPTPSSPSRRRSGHKNIADTISLQRLLIDAYEYHGLTNLLCYSVYVIFAIFALYTQWGDTASNFKSTVVENLLHYDTGDDWQYYDLSNVNSMLDGFQYICGVLKSLIKKTDQSSPTNDTIIYVGQFALLSFARLIVDVNTNDCPTLADGTVGTDFCITNPATNNNSFLDFTADDYEDYSAAYYHADYALSLVDADTNTGTAAAINVATPATNSTPTPVYYSQKRNNTNFYANVNGTRIWIPPGGANSSRLYSSRYTAILASDDPYYFTSRAQMRETLEWLIHYSMNDVSKYSTNMKLQIFCLSRMSEDTAIFTLRVKVDPSGKILWRQVSTTVLKRSWSAAGIGCFCVFIFLAVLDFLAVIEALRLSAWQFGSWWYCFNNLKRAWNWISLLSIVLNAAWIIWWFVLLAQVTSIPFPYDNKTMDTAEDNSTELTSWLYLGMAAVFFVGLRFSRFSRCHAGLACYYNVFIEAGTQIVDFVVFVVYILIVLCTVVFAFFQINGGNPDFVLFSTSLGVMTRISFSMYDWETFYNQAAGLADGEGWVVTLLFWACVVLLVIFVQNTLISIFLRAYENNLRKSLTSESTFIVLVFLRIRFLLQYQFPIFFRALWLYVFQKKSLLSADPMTPISGHASAATATFSAESAMESQVIVTHMSQTETASESVTFADALLYSRLAIYELILSHFKDVRDTQDPRHLVNHPNQLRFARWSIARLPEVHALLAFYMDHSVSDIVQGHPIWRALRDFYNAPPHEDGTPQARGAAAARSSLVNTKTDVQKAIVGKTKNVTGWGTCCGFGRVFEERRERRRERTIVVKLPTLPAPGPLAHPTLGLSPELSEPTCEKDAALLQLPSLDTADPHAADMTQPMLRSLLRMFFRCAPVISGGSWWRIIQVLVPLTNPIPFVNPRTRLEVARAVWEVYKLCERPKIDVDGDGKDDRLTMQLVKDDIMEEIQELKVTLLQKHSEVDELKDLLKFQSEQLNELLSRLRTDVPQGSPLPLGQLPVPNGSVGR